AGGIGDFLTVRSRNDPFFALRTAFDFGFFIVIVVIVLKMVFGVIVDTFGQLRKENSERDESKLNTCYICGLHRRRFDGASVTFEDHTQYYHNTLSYVYFYVYLRVTPDTDLTGPEKYVKHRLQTRTIDWVPILRTWQLPQEQESNAKTKATLRSQVVTLR
ncbi:hypothetical protein SARC_13774, partial [Sphaeroforma arctica JP610]